jgi:hypothetical protein
MTAAARLMQLQQAGVGLLRNLLYFLLISQSCHQKHAERPVVRLEKLRKCLGERRLDPITRIAGLLPWILIGC